MLESMRSFNFDFFSVFLRLLAILARFGEALDIPKIEKIVQDAPKVDFGTSLGRIFFRRWVWEDLGKIWGGFWKGFCRDF